MTLDPAGLAALCAAALPDEHLTTRDLDTCCFGPHTEVLGDSDAAVVLKVERHDFGACAWVLLVVVHPAQQRAGRGRALLDAAVTRAREQGAAEVHLGNASPRYVWPGVDFRFTAALSLFERLGFQPSGAECNMAVDTGFRAEPPNGIVIERAAGDGAVDLAMRRYPHWVDETARAVEGGTCWVARVGVDTIGFACHSVNRATWIGPMATDPDRQRAGVGRALLGGVCADLHAQGASSGDIAWVGPVGFYAKCGARVSRVFRTAKLSL